MGELDGGRQGVRGPQGHGARAQRLIAHARAARQERAVGEEGDPTRLTDRCGERPVVLQGLHMGEEPLGARPGEVEGLLDLAGEVPADDPGGLMALDGAALGGQGHAGAHLDGPVGGARAAGVIGVGTAVGVVWAVGAVGSREEDDGGALQDLLARHRDGQGRALEARVDLAGEEVGEREAAVRRRQ